MKILCVTPYYKPAYVYGGPTRSNSQLCEALVRLGAEVTVLTTNANGRELLDVPLGSSTNVDGVDVFYYPVVAVPPRTFFYSPALAKACQQKVSQFDIAFLDTIFTHAMGPTVVACQQAWVPYVVTLRGALVHGNFKQKLLKKKLYLALKGKAYLNHAAALHCTVALEAEAALKLGIRAPSFVVPNGLDTNRFNRLPARGTMRQLLHIPEQANLLIYSGRLHTAKRPDIAVETLAAVQSIPRETHLVLVGPDEMQLTSKLRAQAQRLGCADRLHITGLLAGDEVLSALIDSDLLLMPSEPESENFGMSALEAMAVGVPILVSDGVPIGEWAVLAGAGRVSSCTPDSFSKIAYEMLTFSESLKDMGRKGYALVREKFDISIIAQQMMGQYQAIISTKLPIPSK
jgi:glycosyltransferase involved in cell wall biosynthesis